MASVFLQNFCAFGFLFDIQDTLRLTETNFEEFPFVRVALEAKQYFQTSVDEGVSPSLDFVADSRC